MARNINSFKNDEKASKNTQNREKKNLKVVLHLLQSYSFSQKENSHFCKLDHRWRASLIL